MRWVQPNDEPKGCLEGVKLLKIYILKPFYVTLQCFSWLELQLCSQNERLLRDVVINLVAVLNFVHVSNIWSMAIFEGWLTFIATFLIGCVATLCA